MAAAESVRLPEGLAGSSMMFVGAVSGIPVLEAFQVRPASRLAQIPPRYAHTGVWRHILGRGRSWVPLMAPHILPFTAGSKATQWVVLSQALGTPVTDWIQVCPLSSLRN